MKRTVGIVTGTRAEYGLLKNLMGLVKADEDMNLQLYVTGMHLSEKYGNTYKAIQQDGFDIDHKIDINIQSGTEVGVAESMGLAVTQFAKAFSEAKPDLLVLLGDRFEILAVAQAAMLLRIPIAHIHGGEKTEGLIDEAIRHSITKMSHLHFTSAEEYRRRVIQLGENPRHVFTVGAPGLDNIKQTTLLTRAELEQELGLKFNKQLFVVTFHPVTLESQSPLSSIEELLRALDQFSNTTVIITLPNADPQSHIIAKLLTEYAEGRDHVFVTPSLGELRYLSTVAVADVVVGNSSSGLIEAPFLKTPTVNIGERQRGRLSGPSVIDCEDEQSSIQQAIERALSEEFREKTQKAASLYGDGAATERIFQKIKEATLEGLIFKSFYDIEFRL